MEKNKITLSEEDSKIWEIYKDRMRHRYNESIKAKEFDELVEQHKDELNKMGKNVFSRIDNWDCGESPVGKCAYDYDSHWGEDDCVYCHEPDERK